MKNISSNRLTKDTVSFLENNEDISCLMLFILLAILQRLTVWQPNGMERNRPLT